MFIVGIIIIFLLGSLLHFVYEISHHNKIAAIFAAVNESTWEHIKICMTATILWSIYEINIIGFNGNFLFAKSMCLLTMILLIPILFYSYTYFTKKPYLIVDITCFLITVICSQLVFNYTANLINVSDTLVYLGLFILFIEILAYLSLTYKPFKNFLFEDPITHKYGLEGHACFHIHKH